MKNLTILILGLCLHLDVAQAQLSKGPVEELAAIAEENSPSSWVYFKPELQLTPQQLVTAHKKAFALRDSDELRPDKQIPVKTGFIKERFQQYHQGLLVFGAAINVFSRDGMAIKANGKLVHDLSLPSKPVVSEHHALEKALAHFTAKDYAWGRPDLVERYRKKKKDPSASLQPSGQLLYMFNAKTEDETQEYALCWKFDVVFVKSGEFSVYINALTGELHNLISLKHDCSPVAVNTPYNGLKAIYTSAQGNCSGSGTHELTDNCAIYIEVLDDNFGNTSADHICAPTAPNNWSNMNAVAQDGAQVLWGMREVSNWHALHHNWISYDNSSGSLDCYVMVEFTDDNGNPTGNNASYSSFWEDFDFGYGILGTDAQDSYTTLDICGHEFTHGVDEYIANLIYQDESGALDESFADIFGETIEKYVNGTPNDTTWLIAAEMNSSNGIRNMANPNGWNDPDTYQGDHWYYGTNNGTKVHTNSGVQNFMYVLLCQGGSGVNDNGDPYSVSGIGLYDAQDIAFVAHSYLSLAATYADARDAWLEAAKDLFGSCSNQAIQTGNAWHAVGVGLQSPDYTEMVTGSQVGIVSTLTREAINQVFTIGTTDISSQSSSPAMVRFLSAYEVILSPGFTAPSGTHFQARINACSITLHTPIRLSSNSINAGEELKRDVPDENLSMKTWPNPFTSDLTIEVVTAQEDPGFRLTITELSGRAVLPVQTGYLTAGTNRLNLDTGDLPSGVYFVSMVLSNGRSYTQKVIRRN